MTVRTLETAKAMVEEGGIKSVWRYTNKASHETLYAAFTTDDHDMFIASLVRDPELLYVDDEWIKE